MATSLYDTHGRVINYLRLSVTDRCNLKCCYCRPKGEYTAHENIMSYEEMERVVNVFTQMGVEKLRLTGGEPFMRKGFMDFLKRLRQNHPDLRLRITTNGVLLAPHAKELKELDVCVNLSLDSLKKEKVHKITGLECFDAVKASMDGLLAEGVALKINTVAMKTVNDDELQDFLRLAVDYPLDFRFIEFMPMGDGSIWTEDYVWSKEEILSQARQFIDFEPLEHNDATDGPAAMYKIVGAKGRFGIISPITNHYCETCNRLRVRSDGRLRTCLYDDMEYNFLPTLRDQSLNSEAKDIGIREIIEQSLLTKPIGSQLLEQRSPCNVVAKRAMFSIGG